MANQEHVDILRQSIEEWNIWRKQHPEIVPDLFSAKLSKKNLIDADFSETILIDADLRSAYLNRVDFSLALLDSADLYDTDLYSANLYGASLRDADLRGAKLNDADLSNADLSNADLSFADLTSVNFRNTKFSNTNFSKATLSQTVFGNVDLRKVKGLETVEHDGPSILGTSALERSRGDIPKVFLQGVGLSDTFIEYAHALVQRPFEYYTCFISYSSKDAEFVDRLYTDLQSKNVRCWLDKEDLKIGDEFRGRIDEAIRYHDKVLLVLSEHSVESDWVKKEVETAFDREQQQKKLILFPVKLDETVMHTDKAWAADIRRMRHIGDFTHWKEHDFYRKTLTRLLRDLKAESR